MGKAQKPSNPERNTPSSEASGIYLLTASYLLNANSLNMGK
jgi:hypothetical protein